MQEETKSPAPELVDIPDDDEEIQIGFGRIKKRFPSLSAKLLHQAITEGLIQYEQKDLIIRDPNIHTILQIRFEPDSPRLIQALQEANLQYADLRVDDYSEHYDKKKKPLLNLIEYLRYITEKYRQLNSILKRRNQLKIKINRDTRIISSKDIRFSKKKFELSEIYGGMSEGGGTGMLTEVNMTEQTKFARINDSTKEEVSLVRQKSLRSGNESFLAGSRISNHERKNKFELRQDAEERHFQRYVEITAKELADKDMYYSEILPQKIEKADKLKQEQLEKIKQQFKTKNDKVMAKLQKNTQQREIQLDRYPHKISEMEENMDAHIEKKNRIFKERMISLSEQRKHQEMVEEERMHKLQYQKQEEEQNMLEIMSKLEQKQSAFQEYQQRKTLSQDKKKQILQLNIEEKQKKVRTQLENIKLHTMKDYLQRESFRQQQLMKHDERVEKEKMDLSQKHLKQIKKIEKRQQDLDRQQLNYLDRQVELNNERAESVLKRHQSLIEIRKIKALQKNQIRQQQSKINYLNHLLNQKQKNDDIIQKNVEQSLNNSIQKQEMEDLSKYIVENRYTKNKRHYLILKQAKIV